MAFNPKALLNKKVAAALVVLMLAVAAAFGKDLGPVCTMLQTVGFTDSCVVSE